MPKKVPQAGIDSAPKEYVSETVTSLAELHRMGRVQSDEDCEARIQKYFQFCGDSGLRPGIEGLSLSLGVTRQTLMRWNRGEDCSATRQQMIESARQYIVSFLEQLLISGKGSTVGCIFGLKNWFSYKDQISFENTAPLQKQTANMTPEQIAQAIEADIPLDADEAEVIDV